jgi:hypothetical protein
MLEKLVTFCHMHDHMSPQAARARMEMRFTQLRDVISRFGQCCSCSRRWEGLLCRSTNCDCWNRTFRTSVQFAWQRSIFWSAFAEWLPPPWSAEQHDKRRRVMCLTLIVQVYLTKAIPFNRLRHLSYISIVDFHGSTILQTSIFSLLNHH